MTKNQRSGSVLVEFLGTGLIAASAMTAMIVCTFLSAAHLLQKTELYFLARSRMYQNTQECGTRSGLWPAAEGFAVAFDCTGGSKVSSEITFFGSSYSRQSLVLDRGH